MRINEDIEVTVNSVEVSLDEDELREAILEYIGANWDGTAEALEAIQESTRVYYLASGRTINGVTVQA